MKLPRGRMPGSVNWPAALRWFAAEFLVVVTGVLVALALGAWWQDRDNRQREAAYLLQLIADLATTEQELGEVREFHIQGALAAARVGHAFWKPEPPTLDELSADLGRPFRSTRERPVLGTIEALIATGDLRLIRSNALRTELTAYAEFAEATIENIQRHDETYYRPGVNTLVEILDTNQLQHESATGNEVSLDDRSQRLRMLPAGPRRPPFPMDIDALLTNRQLYAAYWKLLVAHRNQGINYGLILDRARRLRGLIHHQLHGVLDPGNCQLTGAEGRYTGQCGGLPSGQHVTMIELSEVEEIDSSVEPGGPDAHQLFTGRLALDEGRPVAIALAINVMGRGLIRNADDEFPITELIVDDFAEHLSFRMEHFGDAGYAPEVEQ